MIAGKKYNGLSVDIWSTGIIVFALICGYLPFDDKKTSILYKKIMNGAFKIPKFVSLEANDLIRGILNINPDKRFGLNDIREHKWYKFYVGNKANSNENLKDNLDNQINERVLEEIESLGFDSNKVKTYLKANKFNSLTSL